MYNTLKQQEEMRISGKSARQMVMQVISYSRYSRFSAFGATVINSSG